MKTNSIDRLLSGFVESGLLPGVCAGVTVNGSVEYAGAFGWSDAARERPMALDTVLRVYSLTKPVVALSCLTLAEKTPELMTMPLSEFITAFRNQRVRLPGGGMCTAARENSLTTLLSMTSGIPTWHNDHSDEVEALKTLAAERAARGQALTTIDFVRRIAELPLLFQPGEGFAYGMSMDVAGAVLEVIANTHLSEHLEKTIFSPLGMRDTAFYAKAPARRAQILTAANASFLPAKEDRYQPVLSPPVYENGGDGLYSTLQDYLRFADALACATQPVTEGIVSRMTRPEPSRLCASAFDRIPILKGGYYGLGCMVVRTALPVTGALPGEFGWYGHAGSWFFCEPKRKLATVLLAQRLPSPHTEIVPAFCQAVHRTFLSEL